MLKLKEVPSIKTKSRNKIKRSKTGTLSSKYEALISEFIASNMTAAEIKYDNPKDNTSSVEYVIHKMGVEDKVRYYCLNGHKVKTKGITAIRGFLIKPGYVIKPTDCRLVPIQTR